MRRARAIVARRLVLLEPLSWWSLSGSPFARSRSNHALGDTALQSTPGIACGPGWMASACLWVALERRRGATHGELAQRQSGGVIIRRPWVRYPDSPQRQLCVSTQ